MTSETFSARNILAVIGGLALIFLAAAGGWQARAAMTDAEKADVEQVIRGYLLENPEIILEAIEVLQAREQQAATDAAQSIIADNWKQLVDDGHSSVLGDADATISVIEFMDYNCGWCKRDNKLINELIASGEKVRVIIKEFPIFNSENSPGVSRVALASARQGRYLDMHNALMNLQGIVTEKRALQVAEDLGLNMKQLRRDMDDPVIAAQIEQNINLGTQLRFEGTPGYVIGQTTHPGALSAYHDLEALLERIQEARENCGLCGS